MSGPGATSVGPGGGGPPVPTLAAGAWCAGIALADVLLPAGSGSRVIAAAAVVAAGIAVLAAAVVRPAWPCLVAAALLAGGVRTGAAPVDPAEAMRAHALAGRQLSFGATVVDDPRENATGVEVLLQPQGGDYGAVLVRVRGPVTVGVGDSARATGVVHLPSRTPDFDRGAYLAQRGAHLEMTAADFEVTGHAAGVRGLPAALRTAYRSAVEALLPPPHAALLVGIVLGQRQGVPRELDQQLIATGLVHLLVLSGLKVAVFARLAIAALAPLLGHRAPLPVAALVGLYALVGGATPAAVRAAAMGGLVLVAAAAGRPTHVWTSLAMTAAIMLGWRPELAFDIGFQLSFLGTAAIVLLTPTIERGVKFLPGALREPFAVTCAAQVGTLPITAQGFHVLSPIAPIANAAVLPLLPLMVGAGLLLAPAAVMGDAGRVLALPLAGSLVYLEQVAAVLSRLPAAAIPVPSFPGWGAAAYYATASGVLLALRERGGRRLLALAAATAAGSAIVGWQLPALVHPPPSAAFLNIGDGQAVLLTGPAGRVLVDGGASPTALAGALGARLPPWAGGLDALVITGSGRTETGGLAGLAQTASEVIVPRAPMAGVAWRSIVLDQQSRGAHLVTVAAGQRLRVAGLNLEVLAPEPDARPGDAGAQALAVRALYPDGGSVCVVGPLDLAAQAQAARRLPPAGCSYLLVAGAGRSVPQPELVRAAHPRALVISISGGRLARGLPERLLRRTDQEGTIEVDP